jgi:hypothetical protein
MLFEQHSISDVIRNETAKIKDVIQKLEPNYLLNASEEDLIQALVSELRLDVPVLNEEGIHTSDFGEVDIDVSRDPMRMIFDRTKPFFLKGVRVTVTIPFDGDAGFLHVRPQSFSWQDLGDVRVTQSEILLNFRRLDNDASAIKRGYESALQVINQNLASLRTSVDQFNSQLERQVRQELLERKSKLLANSRMAEAIGLPIKRRGGVPTTYAVPVQKRQPKVERPRASSEKFRPEPVLPFEEYENILTIIRSMVRVMELSPKAFDQMGEEDLRTHFLVQLNAQYEGTATGETFNFQGKTDIIIKNEGKNVFIAECKHWRGEKEFLEAIDQLLSYLSWRDTKTAILLFNRNASFTEVLEKIAEIVPKHACFKRDLGKTDESGFRYVFHQPNDTNRELTLSVLAFDVPTKEHRRK